MCNYNEARSFVSLLVSGILGRCIFRVNHIWMHIEFNTHFCKIYNFICFACSESIGQTIPWYLYEIELETNQSCNMYGSVKTVSLSQSDLTYLLHWSMQAYTHNALSSIDAGLLQLMLILLKEKLVCYKVWRKRWEWKKNGKDSLSNWGWTGSRRGYRTGSCKGQNSSVLGYII